MESIQEAASNNKKNESQDTSIGKYIPMMIIGVLFFIFGFVTWLNGALIPFLQVVCQLSEVEALLIAFTFYIAYVVMAFPMAFVIEKLGYKLSMSLGLFIIAFGFILFVPAAKTQAFIIFLFAQFVVGSGLTILQAASNPYVVKAGPESTAAVRISIMGLLNKSAGVIAPLIFTALILGDLSNTNAHSLSLLSEVERMDKISILANNLILPYVGLAVVLFILGLALKFSPLPELAAEVETTSAASSKTSIFHFPHLILGVVTLFMYVGVEVIAGDTIGLLGSNLGVLNATSLTSYTMAFMVLGYIVGMLLIPRFISQVQALSVSAIFGLVISILIIFSNPQHTEVSLVLWGWFGLPELPNTIVYIALLGFANALVWPAVWPLALTGLGRFTAKGSALLIMGISGGAILPVAYGGLSEYFGGQQAYWMMVPCYLFILFYALKGHKIR
jgi:MFS transporter, FHS family, L-fucose permease